MFVVAEDNRANRILLQVQRHAECVARELEHLAVTCVGQAVNTHDAVGNSDYCSYVTRFRGRFEVLDAFFNQLTDFRGFECHFVFLSS